jgi:hypothetical protein
MCCRGLHELANPAYLEGFPFPALLRVAPYCVPGGARVVAGAVGCVPPPSCLPRRSVLLGISAVWFGGRTPAV